MMVRRPRRLRRLLRVWRKVGCDYCGAPVDRDCRLTCPTRECGQCGGMRQVLDLSRKIGFDEVGNPVYAGQPCPACAPSVN